MGRSFRQAIRDADGKLTWWLSDTTKAGLNRQKEALLAEFPNLVAKPEDAHVLQGHGSGKDLKMAYTIMLDTLGRDNPQVRKCSLPDVAIRVQERPLARCRRFGTQE